MRVSVLAAALAAVPIALFLGSAGPSPRAETPTSASPERQCFSPQQVDNFRSGRANTVYLKVRANTVYEIHTTGACTDVDNAYQLAIQPEFGSSRLCSGDWATIAVPGSAQAIQRCRVQISKVLSAEEVAALPSRYRP